MSKESEWIEHAAGLGHRAAAQGEPSESQPFEPATTRADAWLGAWYAVERYRKQGLDPNGHPPATPPRLCVRDSTKVCNCCATCSTACLAEKPKQEAKGMDWTAILTALPRIAVALESIAATMAAQGQGEHAPVDDPK